MVDSLSNIVCAFIVAHISNVESLVGLPDLIGEGLFELLLQKYTDHSLNREKLIHGLYIFCAAYGPLVLTSINLSNHLILINEYTECFIPLLTNITALNLSHCHFGQDHEILNHISRIKSLKVLCLSDCDLTDSILQKLTIPCRFNRNGFINLQELDLSCNPKLTSKSLHNLICLNSLRVLVLSGTAITGPDAKLFGERAKMQIDKSGSFRINEISTDGWSASLITYWIDTLKLRDRSRKHQPVHFYSQCRARLNMIKELKASPPPKKHPSICLIKQSGENVELNSDLCTVSANLNKSEESIEFPNELAASYLRTFKPLQKHQIKRNLLDALDAI